MESRPDSSTAAMAARSPAPPPPMISTSWWCASLPGILRHSFLVEVAAVAVIDHDGREIPDLDAPDGLRPEVLVRDDVDLPHEPGQHGARSCDRAPFPMVPLRPSSSSAGVNLSMRPPVVGPIDPTTSPGRAGEGPV